MTNVEIAQAAYDAFTRGDIAALLDLCSEDVVWTTPLIDGASFGGRETGREGVSRFFNGLVSEEETTKFEINELIAEGDKVVALGSYGATPNTTGRNYETDMVHVFSFADGRITAFTEFFDNLAVSKAFQKAEAA